MIMKPTRLSQQVADRRCNDYRITKVRKALPELSKAIQTFNALLPNESYVNDWWKATEPYIQLIDHPANLQLVIPGAQEYHELIEFRDHLKEALEMREWYTEALAIGKFKGKQLENDWRLYAEYPSETELKKVFGAIKIVAAFFQMLWGVGDADLFHGYWKLFNAERKMFTRIMGGVEDEEDAGDLESDDSEEE